MAKYSIYAVGYGINPTTKEPVIGLKVDNWNECKQYINGIEGAKYKGFLTDEEADKWIEKTVNDLGLNKPGAATKSSVKQPVVKSRPSDKMTDDVDEARSKFVDICKSISINPNDMVNKLIMDFVNLYSFVTPQQEEAEEDDDGILPFN